MAELTTPIGTTDESRRHLLEQFAERLQRRGVRNPDVVAVVSAARAEAFLEDVAPCPQSGCDR